jgi:hypothetical protein
MNKILLITVLILIAGFIVWKLTRKKRGVVYLGTELANASKKEAERIASGEFAPSPFPDFDYSKWPDEDHLINPQKNELDSAIEDLTNKFISLSNDERKKFRGSVSKKNIYTILTFIQRSTVFAINKKNPDPLILAIASVAMMDAERCDYRDVYMALDFINYGVRKLNLNYNELYQQLSLLSEGKTKEIVQTSYEGYLKIKDTEHFSWFAAVQTPFGTGFVVSGLEPYKPTHDFVKMMLEVSVLLKADKYNPGQISIETQIPTYVFGNKNEKIAQNIIVKANACASITSFIADTLNPYQNLYIYLAEFSNSEQINQLLTLLPINPSGCVLLTLKEGNIFCLLVQRAVMHGKKEIETSTSIQRFEKPIREIIKRSY